MSENVKPCADIGHRAKGKAAKGARLGLAWPGTMKGRRAWQRNAETTKAPGGPRHIWRGGPQPAGTASRFPGAPSGGGGDGRGAGENLATTAAPSVMLAQRPWHAAQHWPRGPQSGRRGPKAPCGPLGGADGHEAPEGAPLGGPADLGYGHCPIA